MNQRNQNLKLISISVLLVITMVGLFFGNLAFVKSNPGGLDFFAHWQGTRAFISQGINPYSGQAAGFINSGINEVSPESGESYRFVLPLFSLIFLTPVSLIAEFSIARAIWMTLLEGLVLLSGYLIAGWMGKRRSRWLTLIVILVLLLNFSTASAIQNGNMTIIGLTAIFSAIHFLLKKNDEPAGLLLGFSLVKPDLVYPILLILFFWIFVTRRFTVLIWFLATFVLLVGFSMVLIPSWPIDYAGSVIEFSARNPVRVEEWLPSALDIRLLLVKNLAIAVVVIYEWFVVKTKGPNRFLWSCGFLLAVLPWIGGLTLQEHTFSVYAAMLIGLSFLNLNRGQGFSVLFIIIAITFGISGWLFSGTLIPGISEAWKATWLTFVLPVTAFVLLYWSRWWVIRHEKFSEDHFSLS